MGCTELPTKEELDSLLAIASQKLQDKDNTKVSDVYMFIIDRNIKAGTQPITPTHVYDEYCAWSTAPKSHSMFGREFKRYFLNSKRTRKGNIYYLLDPSSFDMSEEAEIERKQKLRERHFSLHDAKQNKKD
jgi:hypothetical protein